MSKFRFSKGMTLAATGLVALVACGPTPTPTDGVAQGVTDTTILVGNAATTGGPYAAVGIPFNAGLKASLHNFNEKGGHQGRKVKFVNYNDNFSATEGLAATKRLVETDKVFALVGHFGTPTVGATVDYIKEEGIPMVYAATGINALYAEKDPGNPVLPIQPIYRTEGQLITARILAHQDLFGTATKIGIAVSNDDAGESIYTGVKETLDKLGVAAGNRVYVQLNAAAASYSNQALQLKNEAVDVVIAATNQAPFTKLLTALEEQAVEVPVITSYVSAATANIPESVLSEKRRVFTNAWVDLYSEDGKADQLVYADVLEKAHAAKAIDDTEYGYATNAALASYALAGYVAAETFIAGLNNLGTETISWENYIKALEKGPIDIPLTPGVNFAEGNRLGIDSLLLIERVPAARDATGFVLAKTAANPTSLLDSIK